MRIITTAISLLILCAGLVPASAGPVLKLPSGAEVSVVAVKELNRDGGKKGIMALLNVGNLAAYDDKKRSIIADEFFERYFGPYAEDKKYQFAELGVGGAAPASSPDTSAFVTAATYKYERAENGVWHPGHDSSIDNEPIEEAKKVTLPSGAIVHVEFQGTSRVNVMQGDVYVGAFWADIPLTDVPRLYPRLREYWTTISAHIPADVKIGSVVAFDRPKLGYFHFRDALIIMLKRTENGSWPELPQTWGGVEGNQSGLIQTSFRKDRIKTIWPDH